MDSRARVEAAIAGRKTDHPPVGAWGHTYKEEWSPEQLASVTIERQRRYGWDFVKFQPRATFFAEAFGNRYEPSGHRLKGPVILEAAVPDLESWKGLKLVDRKPLAEQARALGLVVKELGDRVPVLQTVFSPISVAGYLVGKDKRRVVRELRKHPEVVLPALERIGEALMDFSRDSVAQGAAGLFYAISGYATPDSMPVDVYESLLLPLDQRIVDSFPEAAWFNVLHLCGSHINIDVARKLRVPVVSWSTANQGNPSLEQGRKLTGRAVMGGVAQRTTMLRGTPEQVGGEVKAAIGATGGLGVLIAPGCSVPPRARDANLKAMAAAAAA